MSPIVNDGLSLSDGYFEGLDEKLKGHTLPQAGPPEAPRQPPEALPEPPRLSDSVEARAFGLLNRYLSRHPLTEPIEVVARAAYLNGFRDGFVRGGRDALEQSTALSTALQDSRMRMALAALLQFIEARA